MGAEKNKKRGFFSTTRKIALGFLVIIFIGTVLLMLPVSSAGGESTNFVDALFTAVTSVCVTGLVTVTTATHWSLFGKVVILVLIQLGGLGVICCGIAILMLFGKKINLKDRIMIQESYGIDEETYSDVTGISKKKKIKRNDGLILRIIKGTFIVEGIGAILFSFRFIPDFGVKKGIWYAIFHSVSAFCNAGLDLLGDVSLMDYRGDVLVNMTASFLVITGGIGFIVWWDIIRVIKKARKSGKYKNMLFKRLSLHSKIALVTTLTLLAAGAVLFFIFEYNNPDTIGNEPLGNKILMSFFQSVTTRTAGFLTMFQENLTDASYILALALMLIGGSPMGTAGGLKTTTIAMILVCVWSVVRGKKDTEAFGRKISSENIRTGIAVVSISMMILVTAIMALSVVESFPLKTIVFESVSAIATVGLGAGMTAGLTSLGKCILILLMYVGRIGPITMAMAFSAKRSSSMDGVELAEKKIIIG